MRHILLGLTAAGILAGCAPEVPDSAGHISDEVVLDAERRARDVQLSGGAAVPAPTSVETGTLPPVPGDGGTQVHASPSNPAPATVRSNPGISDENDFAAVSSRETIQSDAERLRRNSENYRVIEATNLPGRGNTGANIVEFALSTSHAVGTPVYRRIGIGGEARANRNCRRYAAPDLAQKDFLARGGPEKDPRGLDPDGDGFACAWDPEPFRLVSQPVAAQDIPAEE